MPYLSPSCVRGAWPRLSPSIHILSRRGFLWLAKSAALVTVVLVRCLWSFEPAQRARMCGSSETNLAQGQQATRQNSSAARPARIARENRPKILLLFFFQNTHQF